MKDIFSRFVKPDKIFMVVLVLVIAMELFAIGAFSYLGVFNRYLADDYCESASIRSQSVVGAVIKRYMDGTIRSSDRYSNLLFVGISEMFGKYRLQILSSSMMFLWLIGLLWMLHELQKLIWGRLPVLLEFGAAVSIVFFSVWQAPNRFQTFLWRSGMATHFIPLVLISLLSGFLLSQVNSARKPSLWTLLVVVVVSFFLGGFSEPPTIVALAIIGLVLLITLRWNDSQKRQPALSLLLATLAGFFLALLVMFLSPGNLSNGTASLASLPATAVRTFQFTYDFMVDTIKTLPLPTLVSMLIPFFVFFNFSIQSEDPPLKFRSRKQILIWLIVVPLLQYLLIAVSFSPSVHGQSAYPEGRARFLGRLIMTISFLVEGALFGMLFAGFRIFASRRNLTFLMSTLILFVLAFYPFRAGLSLLAEVPDYRQWTSAWDLRETEIQKAIASGEKDLVVRWLPTKANVKEIDANPKHWVNKCVADYYGVNTVRSVPMGGQ